MISIIVPTMWAYPPFLNFLENILELNCIGEVIIINNCVEDTPNHNALNHKKVKLHNMEKNIFVNPAWNLGAHLSKFDILCFLSDDVLVDMRVFQEANKFVNKEVGILGFVYHPALYHLQSFKKIQIGQTENYIVTGDIKIEVDIEPLSIEKDFVRSGNGALFFLHKENYVNIPEDFLIYGGDVWLYTCQKILKRKNYFIKDCFFYSPWRITAESPKLDTSHGDFSKENRQNFLKKIKEFKSKYD